MKTVLRSSVDASMLTANKSRSRFSHDTSAEGNWKFSPGEVILTPDCSSDNWGLESGRLVFRYWMNEIPKLKDVTESMESLCSQE